MKRIIITLCLLLYSHNFHAFPISGSLIGEDTGVNDILRFRVRFLQDNPNYINGGLTYIYPSFSFSDTPNVIISIQLLSPFNPAITYVPVIQSNSSSGLTIRINKLTDNGVTTTITEAATNEVRVNIFASGV